jgi:hypothetical protein
MKKIAIITSLILTVTGLPSFGQGYLSFGGGSRSAWDNFTTPGTAATAATVNVAFLWAANGSALPNGLNAIAPTTATNGAPINVAAAWSSIMSGGAFQFATNSNTGLLVVQGPTGANGSWNYAPGGIATFGLAGTAPSTTYSMFVIGWSAQYADPFTAAANNSAVGWTSVFTDTLVANTGTPSAMGINKFGVLAPAAVPEPATMALFALGGASVLLFRRRK